MIRMLATILIVCTAIGAYPHEIAEARAHKAALGVEGLKYLDLSTIQEINREEGDNAMRFWIPHLSRSTLLDHQRPEPLPGTSLCAVDIDRLSWGWRGWVAALKHYPYSVYVDSHGHLCRDENPLTVRVDWLLADTSDMQLSQGKTYYQLLYAGLKIPTTEAEFDAVWGFNAKQSSDINAGVVIEENHSGVARQKRLIVRDPTARGTRYKTFDSLRPVGKQDPLQTYHPNLESDANEVIQMTPKIGIHPAFSGTVPVYFLLERGRRVDVANTAIVEDRLRFRNDPSIRTPGSCTGCHLVANGPKQNLFREMLASGVEVTFKSIEEQIFTDRFFLSDDPSVDPRVGALAESVAADNILFERFVKAACGDDQSPGDVVADWTRTINRYDAPLDLEQASLEVASEPNELKLAIAYYSQVIGPQKTVINLVGLASGNPVARKTWESEVYPLALLSLWTWRHRQ